MALEELVTHFERTIHDLNDALLGQQQQITALERRVTQLVAELASVADKTPEPPRRLEDDKPPHY